VKNDLFEQPDSNLQTIEPVSIPDLKKIVAGKKKPISTQRIAEVGVMSAALVVVFLVTGAVVDSLLPFIGCMIRTIAMAIFISGFRHYSGLEFFLINLFGSIIYFLLYPCPSTALSLPISMSFVLVYNILRRKIQPWLAIMIGIVFAYMVLIAVLPLLALNAGDITKFWEYFNTTLKWSGFLLLLVPVAWWRQARSKVLSCTGCTMDCNSVSLDQ
jgi:hypothetical protein